MKFNRKSLSGGLIAFALLIATPSAAHAESYSSSKDSQDFTSGAGGWSQATTSSGLCLPELLCPGVSDDWVGSGGDGGGGYLRTQFTSLATTLAGTSAGVWQGPAFTYQGNKGKVPAAVNLDLDIRPQLTALLGLTVLNDSSYQVDLVDTATGHLINAVPQTTLVNSASWQSIPSAALNPRLLTIGRSYRIQITTTYHAVATVVAIGEVGYDNVRLTASGHRGSGITNSSQLTEYVSTYGISSSAHYAKGHLQLTLRCPVKASPKRCAYRVWGLANGKHSGRATVQKYVVVGAGHHRTVRLRVKHRYLAHYQHAHRILVKATVRAGRHVHTTVVRGVKLTH